MLLMRDLLDKQVLDRNRNKIGKVDGVVIALKNGEPPVITHLEIGSVALARRLTPGFGRLWSALALWAGGPDRQEPFCVPWSKVQAHDIEVKIDVTRSETPLDDWQDWLRRRVIGRIPGA